VDKPWVRRVETAIVGIIFLSGLWFFFGQLLLSKFDAVPGDLGDTRFNGLVLEHGYRALRLNAWHRALWSPSWSFFPHKNVLAYSDNLLGTLPIYALVRLLGLAEMSALNAWIVMACVANFAAMYFLLRQLELSRIGAAVGAFLFAFAMPRGEQLNHVQLMPQFFTPLCFYFIAKLKTLKPWAVWGAVSCMVLQIYAAVYVGWFLALALGVLALNAAVFVLVSPEFRRALRSGFRCLWPHAAAAFVLAIVALLPMGVHYLRAQAEVGPRQLNDIHTMLPRLASYGIPADYTYLYPSMLKLRQGIPVAHEHVMFSGFVALACGLAMVVSLFAKPRRFRLMEWRWVFATIWLFTFVSTLWIDGSLWTHLHRFIPAAGAIRAVSRIVMLQLFALGAAAAWALTELQKRGRLGWVAAFILAAFVVLENSGSAGYNFSIRDHTARVERVRSELKREPCEVFFINGSEDAYKTQIDAMWASLETQVPTINGYSGNIPPRWPFESARNVRAAQLRSWLTRHHHRERLCLLQH